ncbi:hypothetical protein EKO04_006182 [Ascochyta lentis]|uniref:ZN622/Rei1/Reh1 zinc finger C2H2-type domain-containing protein n=1 Tax=Ascochyta lentis TaxID=205686 RepID=A0A8H7J2V5_9PLEO|nr:hypothetical protein EKO04_006182 [Ascochyta lentis]
MLTLHNLLQREHMKTSWHVYNLKRRITCLPPIPLDVFENKIQIEPALLQKKHTTGPVSKIEQDTGSLQQCLFCQLEFECETEDLDSTLEHMFTVHGLFIPNQDMLSYLASFVGYLATVVRVWHECLFCGASRTSTLAIQSHMRDSGHCMLNLEREPELEDFWERASDAENKTMNKLFRPGQQSAQELELRSGKTVCSNWLPQKRTQATKNKNRRLALRAEADSPESPKPFKQQSCRQLARRDEMGIQNINSQQRHALVLAEKRSQQAEAVATKAKQWTYARKANDQKHDQAYGPLSWAKGGAHNLLPR